MSEHEGRLPERLSLGCGTREYSATREESRPELDKLLLKVRPFHLMLPYSALLHSRWLE